MKIYNTFLQFDPLVAKTLATTEVAALAQKREIKNILSSYVGWYDPFSELIQNSLDSVEERMKIESSSYEPTLWITINIEKNCLTITDNGIGLDENKFSKFLCPDISFKSGKTRGHKGVGATYLAYGFNFIQVASKSPDFHAVGKMEDARNWLDDESPAGNPNMKPDMNGPIDPNFVNIDRGVSIHILFDKTTHPKDLKWLVTDDAENWFKILSVKTGLGAFTPNKDIQVNLTVVDKYGKVTIHNKKGIEYYWAHRAVSKSASFEEIIKKSDELFLKKGNNFELPSKYKNLDAVYQYWTTEDLLELSKHHIKLDEDDIQMLDKYNPQVYIAYFYSTKVWDALHNGLKSRAGAKIIHSGIQIAANNMPQGELIQIPLNRNIGRQNQIHCIIHFDNCSPDLGRKGFQGEIVDFAKELSKKLSDGPLMKVRSTLRANTGASPHLSRENAVDIWKSDMADYEIENPLELINSNFFLPTRKISITSKPSREQDVIALFNQLIAGGVIRGIKIMSTNERLTYDGLFRIMIDAPKEHHLYNQDTNPLGIERSVLDEHSNLPFVTKPKILEYKFSLDGLIEDIENGVKNSNDVGLVVVWNTDSEYTHNYKITSFLDPDNLTLREYHGVTHCITNLNSGQREMDLIVLSELISFLNNPELEIEEQRAKYED
jgi:hypothetical protein